MVVDVKIKGKKGKGCNRTACPFTDAYWYNRITKAYYCEDCARMINQSSKGSGLGNICSEETEELLGLLKQVYNEEISATYFSGILKVGDYACYPERYEPRQGMLQNKSEGMTYSDEEKYWWAKCYVKYKTSNHAFYESSKEIIDNYGKSNQTDAPLVHETKM